MSIWCPEFVKPFRTLKQESEKRYLILESIFNTKHLIPRTSIMQVIKILNNLKNKGQERLL
jgi:hypothetical protein